MKKLSFLIYKILKLLDNMFLKVFRRSFLLYFNNFFNEDFYNSIKINNKETKFFAPNDIIKWRLDSLFSKEPETLEWIDSFESNKGEDIIFWDIGANIGLYSIYAAQKHKNIIIYSFEPSTSNLRVLSRNISINELQNKIIINQFPLLDKEFSFFEMNEPEFIEGWAMNTYGEALDYKGEKFVTKQKYRIFGASIDYLIEKNILKIPNYIKIDVDGAEDKILSGGLKFLGQKNVKSISIELNEEYISQYQNVFKILTKLNFNLKHKKHADMFDINNKFSKLYNFVFDKHDN
tara:strand:- start:5418 stop:6290 length:873 start_codon:yes stop_codon:yes gene_type:complete